MVDFAKLNKERKMATRRKMIVDEVPESAVEDLGKSLQNKYRPEHLDDVFGQKAVVTSIKKSMRLNTPPHVFLFSGPVGTGKTSISRILGADLNCQIIEIDAASHTGIDDMRAVMAGVAYHGFGERQNKGFIIDECHRLSKQAWDSLLKIVEEPPPHVYFFFCTTEPSKVPAAVVSRANDYTLKPLRYEETMDLLEMVADKERFDTSDKILSMIGRACEGSPRTAIKMLSKVYDITDPDEAAVLLDTALDNMEIIDLCRQLVGGKMNWSDVQRSLKAVGDVPPETIRIVIVNYLNSCILGAKTDQSAGRLCDMLHAFTRPTNPADKLAPILLAFSEFVLRN